MAPFDPQTITRLLNEARDGESSAAEALLPLVYEELHGLAERHFSDERRAHTLQPTALIHEAWMKLDGKLEGLEGRRHFFAVCSRAMRQVLADHARARGREKRGSGKQRVTLHENVGQARAEGIDLVELHDLLERLAQLNERHARVVELRMLGGLTIAEAAEVLDVSHFTIEKDWFTARAWLRTELKHI